MGQEVGERRNTGIDGMGCGAGGPAAIGIHICSPRLQIVHTWGLSGDSGYSSGRGKVECGGSPVRRGGMLVGDS